MAVISEMVNNPDAGYYHDYKYSNYILDESDQVTGEKINFQI